MADSKTISTARLAFLLGTSAKTIAGYAQRGIVKRTGHGRYDLALSVQGFAKHMREMARSRGGEAEIIGVATERRRLLRSQADREQLRLEQERGEWLPRGEVLAAWKASLSVVRARLLATPARLAQVCGLDNEAAEKLDEEIREVLTELARPQSYAPEVEVVASE
jgi:phage terminase Nu1 subunit (DNA packaging protein)